jgi:hypothetical protein
MKRTRQATEQIVIELLPATFRYQGVADRDSSRVEQVAKPRPAASCALSQIP